MTHKEIQELINLVAKTNLSEVKLINGDFKLIIRSKEFSSGKAVQVAAPAPAPQPATQVAVTPPASAEPAISQVTEKAPPPTAPSTGGNYIEIKSPMVGTFYRASGPDKPAFVQVGDNVSKGQRICIIEAMKLFNEIESEVSGKIVKVLVDDSTPVEYDQPLFLVDPAG